MSVDDSRFRQVIRDEWKRRVRGSRAPIYVRAVGIPYKVEIEPGHDQSRVDHVWLTIQAGEVGRVLVSINTLSRYNRDAGFDPRIRLGILKSTYTIRPEPHLAEHAPLDYTIIEATNHVDFVPIDHDPIEELLINKCNEAVRAEVWGELYIREHLGIHQIHSRRASCAVARDVIGMDGGIRLYYRDGVAELLMFKFCGQ